MLAVFCKKDRFAVIRTAAESDFRKHAELLKVGNTLRRNELTAELFTWKTLLFDE